MAVRLDLNISLDGFTSGNQTPENPMGEDWSRLMAAYTATRTMREVVFKDTCGAGTTGVDDKYANAYFAGVGAEIMGAGMFGFHSFPDDRDWQGWWGDEPPFHFPVFVLTHSVPRPSMQKSDTTFHFLSVAPKEALARAVDAAGGKDVRVGGGISVTRDFLKAGLVDQLHVSIAPIVLGRGVRLWDDLRGLESDYEITTETAESGTIHVTFSRVPAPAGHRSRLRSTSSA